VTALASAGVVAVVKCKGDVKRFVPQAHGPAAVSLPKAWLALMGLGQENLLSFLLFWIGFYVSRTLQAALTDDAGYRSWFVF
jgi:hypothetical protein